MFFNVIVQPISLKLFLKFYQRFLYQKLFRQNVCAKARHCSKTLKSQRSLWVGAMNILPIVSNFPASSRMELG